MIKYENQCCDCAAPGYPCMGNSCPNINVPVYYCDICKKDEHAEYQMDDTHYCEECAKIYIREVFDELTVSEQAEMLGIPLKLLEE